MITLALSCRFTEYVELMIFDKCSSNREPERKLAVTPNLVLRKVSVSRIRFAEGFSCFFILISISVIKLVETSKIQKKLTALFMC